MSIDPQGGLDAVANTSRLTAAVRAAESARPDRLFDDPFADTLAGDVGRTLAARLANAADPIAVRTRFDDDGLRAAVRAGVGQVVLVAAGMDTRAWRLDLPDGCVVFELDRPAVLALKADLLDGRSPAARRVPVPVDLAACWAADLTGVGFDPDRPTCWIVEGLLEYLPETSVLGLLDAVTGLSAPGSHLITDLVGSALLASPAARPMLDVLAALGSPWLSGTDDPDPLFTNRGWRCDVRPLSQVASGLGRAPMALADDVEGAYLVHAAR